MALERDSQGRKFDRVQVAGSIPGDTLEEQLTEADLVGGDLTFSAVITYVEIVNRDTGNVGTFTVNGVVITVDPQVAYGPVKVAGTESATVAVSGSTTFIVSRYT